MLCRCANLKLLIDFIETTKEHWMTGNHARKKLDAFYHNQQLDYENWLKANTIGQRRQRISTARRGQLSGFIGAMLVLTSTQYRTTK